MQLDRAVDGGPLLVAGEEKTDRARERAARDEAQRGGERGGDAALHVAGAASPDLAVGERAGERIEAPFARVARRHDVGVAGEDEIRRARAEARVEIVDRRRPRRRERDDLGGEPRFGEQAFR